MSPLYVWLALISKLPHKEERFLFVAYPLVRSSSSEAALLNQPPRIAGWLAGSAVGALCVEALLGCRTVLLVSAKSAVSAES